MLGLTAVRAGTDVLDVRSMVILGFQNRAVALFYILAVGLLSLHLLHGAGEHCSDPGLAQRAVGGRPAHGSDPRSCAACFLGNLAIPGAVRDGAVLHAPEAAVAAPLPSTDPLLRHGQTRFRKFRPAPLADKWLQ